MTRRHAEELLTVLRQQPLTLDALYERVRLTGSTWTPDQLVLFLACALGVSRDSVGAYRVVAANTQDELQQALIEAVRSFAGKPVPAEQVRARLPQQFVTTDEQIIVLARRTEGLEVFGPKLIRLAR